jgi:hypothetical protein
MRQPLLTLVGLVALGLMALGSSFVHHEAKTRFSQTVTVDVTMSAFEDMAEGEMCETPGQVIIRDAAGIIVGTVDLIDITTVFDEAPVSYLVVQDGLCAFTQDVELPASDFYTFTIQNLYEWTISADDLAGNDWTFTIRIQ